MYLNGHIGIDPSAATELQRVKPTRGFARLAYFLTAGMASEKEEHETFCAVSILQQLFIVLRSLGIDNIVRLAKDDFVFYQDDEGRKGDLRKALDQFSDTVDDVEAGVFSTLTLVLEHPVEGLQCLLEVSVHRVHRPGEDPISVHVNGLVRQFKTGADEDAEAVKRRLQPVFSVQDQYDALMLESRSAFQRFLGEIEHAVRKHMRVDRVTTTSDVRIIRPKGRVKSRADIPRHTSADPVYRGYYGYDDYTYYGWVWADMCHAHHIHCHDVVVVDDFGAEVFEVGPEGFDAGATEAMDPDQTFEAPSGDDVRIFGGNEYIDDASPTVTSPAGGDSADGDSWLSSAFDGDSGDSGDSCSSCSSCGGCGGD